MVDIAQAAEQKISDRPRWYSVLYVQVLLAIVLGAIVGYAAPDTGKALKPLGDAFIQLIKMMIAPVIFCTVVHGIASMGDLHKVGRVGIKTLIYFEVVSTIALVIGLLVGEIIRPGPASTSIPQRSTSRRSRATSPGRRREESCRISSPSSRTRSSARWHAATCCRCCWCRSSPVSPSPAWARCAARSSMRSTLPRDMFFGLIRIIIQAAPIGAFGAMAFTVGTYGLGALLESGRADRHLLPHQPAVRAARARDDRAARRFLDPAIHRLHQGRTPDRARHQLVGDGAAAADAEDGTSRRLEVDRRPGRPDRLQFQSRRHQHLHDAGDACSWRRPPTRL